MRLARRRTRDYLNDLWAGAVWGAPAALALTAVTEILLNIPSKASIALFWLMLLAAMAWALRVKDPARARAAISPPRRPLFSTCSSSAIS